MMKRFLHILLVSVCVCIPAQAEVIISQVFYDTPLNEEINRPPYSNGEFIELHNTAPFADTIAGWSLHGGGKTEVYEFPNGTFVPANGYLIVAYRHNATPNFLLDSLIAVPDSCQVLYQRKIVLSNSGENLALYNAVGERVDTVHYTARQAANDAPITIDECRSIQRIAYSCDQTGQVVCRQQDWHADLIHLGAAIPQQTWLPSSDYYSPELPLSADNPYLISVTPRSSVGNVTVSDGQATLTGGGMAQVSVDWCNPLGKPTMQMMRKQSPSGKNLVTMTQNMGFETRQWLPIPVESDDMLSSESFSSVASTYHQDAAPYVSTNIEQTFHGRPTATTKPGDTYQAHPTQELYGINVGGEIKRWQVGTNSATRDGYYQGGTLRKYTHTDEDGKSTTKYVNPQGQTILLRIANDAETHYIYDYLGRLRYVLPPLCSNAVGNSFTDETEKIKQYAYIYKYDDRGNCIYKKLPGCEPIYMVYDKAGRQVLSQDGNQRGRGDYWTMASYTELGQVAFTAAVQLANSIHNDLIQYWNTESDTVTFSATGQGNAYFGYITDAQIEQPLVVNYYDNYDFLSLLPTDIQTNLTYSAKNGYGEQYANSTGLLTGKRVYSLADNSYTTTAYYYDADGNIIQQRSTIWNGGYDIMWAAYNFDGTVSRTLEQQPNATEAYWYEYDMSGRLLRTRYQLNDEPVILLSNNTYTELGQQDTILRHNDTDITSYDYDLLGNTTHISSGDFSEQITYAKNGHGYNGTISATTLTQGNVTLQWDYQYDSHNRLSSAQWSEGEDTWEAEKFTYDPMGNILTLKRRNRETLIDDLNYSYAGNQLKAISDAAGEQGLYDQKEYFDYSNAENTMNYDANGNLLADFDRKICTIQYNLLNLPAIIQFCNGNSIVNTYNAEGVKLSSTYYTLPEAVAVPVGEIVEPDTLPQAPQTMIVQYLGHIEKTIIGDSVSYTLHHPEGYITLDALHRVDSWNYFRRDHLGNNVAVWNASADTTIQRMFYYPSGLPIGISTGQGTQPYKYNGKEYDEMHGYDVYEYGFRGYYATIARFTSIDPLCERTPWQSPYCYASNNFVGEIDWMGLFGSTGFASGGYGTCHWIAVDENDIILGMDLNSPDQGVYVVDDDNWDRSYWDLLRYKVVGNHKGLGLGWSVGACIRGMYNKSGNGYYNSYFGTWVKYGTIPRQNTDLLYSMFCAMPSLVFEAISDITGEIIDETGKGILWGQHLKYDKFAQKILSRCTTLGIKLFQNAPVLIAVGFIVYDMYSNGFTPNNISNVVITALSWYLADVAVEEGIIGLGSVLGTGAVITLGVGLIAAEIYGAWYGLKKITNSINTQYGNRDAMMDIYWNGF